MEDLDPHQRAFLETGIPNLVVKGDVGTTRRAYPNGLPRERFARAVRRAMVRLRLRRREETGPPAG